MTTAMSAHQEPPRERLGPPAAPGWQPKRNKRKDFKPRCAPAEASSPNPGIVPIPSLNPGSYSPQDRSDFAEEEDYAIAEERMERDDHEDNNDDSISKCVKIGVKNMVMLKGTGAVDLSGRRISTDSNENIESTDFRGNMLDFAEHQKRMEALRNLNVSSQFQQSYIQSLQLPNLSQQAKNFAMNSGMTPSEYKSKNFSTKSPFAISQLIKTNSPTRRRDSDNSDELDDDEGSLKNEDSPNNDGSGGEMTPDHRDKDEPMDVEDGDEDNAMQNGENPNNNKVLTDYAVNTMKELLGIYGLSSNEVAEALTGQVRAIEALQAGKPYPAWLQRRWQQGAMGHLGQLGQLGMMGSRFPEERETQSPVEAHRLNSMQDDSGSGMDSDGDRTLDLSLSKDHDVQDLSTASSAGNSVAEFEQQSLMMRRNLEDLAGLHGIFSKPQSSMENEDSSGGELRAKLSPAALLASLSQLDGRRQAAIPALDYSRYVKRYGSALECGSSYCKDLGYREHFHCLDCSGRVFCKKEEMIRHFKWHKKRDESLAHGFMRYSPLDDCGERGPGCPHNRSQTHYHCIQDGCDKVYISTSDVQMHANYHRKDSAILQEGFQRFRATERCTAPHCAFRGQRTTHFHCRRPGCRYTFKNKADMEKHKTYHIKDEQLARDGFKKYMKNEPCPYRDCRFSRMCNHIHCIRPRCNYVLHSSSQLFSHKRKHERKDQELNYGIPSAVMHSSMFQQSPEELSMKMKQSLSPKSGSLMGGDMDDNNSMGGLFGPPPLIPLQSHQDMGGDVLEHQQNLNQMVVEEVCRKYIHTFNGGADEDDKCQKCSAFNKHYHCLAEGCNMAHSCHSTMVKHSLEHEHQCQVTEAYFQTFGRSSPCGSSSCHHIRDQTHFHCTWENCGCVILPSEEQPFRRLEHHRQHALLSPLSPTLGRLAHALAPNPLSSLNPNLQNIPQNALNLIPNTFQNQNIPPSILQSLPPSLLQNLPASVLQSLPANILQSLPASVLQNLPASVLQNLSPSLLQNLNPNLLQSLNPGGSMNPQGHMGPASSLDEMFSRKRGRPPKNRVVEVWADHATPQAIFTSFKLPKSNQMTMPQSPLPPPEEFSKIKFHHFDVYTTPDACGAHHPACQIRSSRVHMHCSHCAFTSEDHPSLETHSRETHSVSRLLEGFDYYQNSDECNVSKCVRSQMRAHFHCSVGQCTGIMTQYSSLIGHKHKNPEAEMDVETLVKKEEVRDYSMKGREAALDGFHGGSLVVKSESDADASVSVVKAAGTFYPSSHERSSISPSSSRGPGMCQLCLARPLENQGVCTHLPAQQFEGSMGLAATKETLEREYPEISILPSTASSTPSPSAQRQSQGTQSSPLNQTPSRAQQQAEGPMRQAVHSLLLQQYLAQAVGKPPSLDHIKYHGMPPMGHKQQLPFMRSPFPLYPGMMYPPELLMEQSGLMGSQQSMASSSAIKIEKDVDLINKRVHQVRSTTNMRMLKDEPIPEGYLRFRFNEDCAYQHCGYREHQTHFHCTRRDCGYSFCDKTRFVQHTARHERLDTLMGGDFQQYRANVFCGRQDCAHASNFGASQNKASHFHCLKCEFVCTDTNKVVAHRRQHQKMDSIQAAGFDKFPPSKACGFDPQCIHSKKQTHYHCLQCGFAVLGLSQMTSHKYRHQENSHGGAGTSGT